MGSLAEHCEVDIRHLSNEYPDVHKWLDHFYKSYGGTHRRFRHHREGIIDAKALYGEEASKAAQLHILLDMGHIPSKIDWYTNVEIANITNPQFDHMGRRVAYLKQFKGSAEYEYVSHAYCDMVNCLTCKEVTNHRLLRVQGEFLCEHCGQVNWNKNYKMKLENI